MLTFKEAQEILIGLAGSFGSEYIELDKALGRTLAEPVFADRDYPPFNRATMDGYAVQSFDLEKGLLEFEVADTIFAGEVSDIELASGQCYKIMTGASVPPTANVVIRREDTRENGRTIQIQPDAYRAFQNIARQGEDMKAGTVILHSPVNGSPAVISVLAALGKRIVKVERLPQVALFTTGNEVVSLDQPVSPVQIRNSNQYLLKSLLRKWGIEPFLVEHIRDDKKDLYEMLQKGLSGDIIIISGGVSAGDADYVPEILESLGVKKLFHKIAIKPGKPIWCGYIPGGAMVFALPGNPFSSLVTFTLFVETYLSHCFNIGNPATATLPLIAERTKKSDLDEFFPVSVREVTIGAQPLTFNGSGDILAALQADGIAHHPALLSTISSPDSVEIRLFKK